MRAHLIRPGLVFEFRQNTAGSGMEIIIRLHCICMIAEIRSGQCIGELGYSILLRPLHFDHRCIFLTQNCNFRNQFFASSDIRHFSTGGRRFCQILVTGSDLQFLLTALDLHAVHLFGIFLQRFDLHLQASEGADVLVHPLAEFAVCFHDSIPGIGKQGLGTGPHGFGAALQTCFVLANSTIHRTTDTTAGAGFSADFRHGAIGIGDVRQHGGQRHTAGFSHIGSHGIGLSDHGLGNGLVNRGQGEHITCFVGAITEFDSLICSGDIGGHLFCILRGFGLQHSCILIAFDSVMYAGVHHRVPTHGAAFSSQCTECVTEAQNFRCHF